jgi:hypothetical protein
MLSAQAALPPAPAGFTWNFVSSATYTDSDSVTQSLNSSGNFGTPSVTGLAQSLSLTTFNEASAPSGSAYMVTSSTFSSSLMGSTNATILNFSGGPANFTGAVSIAGASIGGTVASGGPVTTSISRATPLSVPTFGIVPFSSDSGATSTLLNVTSAGPLAINDGSNINFVSSGNSVVFIQSSAGPGPTWTSSGSVTLNASLNTNYDVYQLVPLNVPEPSATVMLGALGLVGLAHRRRR